LFLNLNFFGFICPWGFADRVDLGIGEEERRSLFYFMTRTELRDKMLISGELERPSPHNQNWKDAFELYKKESGDYEVSTACGACYEKVKRWLTK
jgi:hypothetical protein